MSASFKVREFHHAFGIPVLDKPQVPPQERTLLKMKLILEETLETIGAAYPGLAPYLTEVHDDIVKKMKLHGGDAVNLPEVADGLADVIYVVTGTNLEFGIDGDAVFSVVHEANMKKIGGSHSPLGKIMKPEGWVAPDIKGELVRQGWKK
jgi:predicted HAD superfamily Cof-like phosphohydrolase